jgi:hypothetical protein
VEVRLSRTPSEPIQLSTLPVTLVVTCAEIGSYGYRCRSSSQEPSSTTTAKEHRSVSLPEETSGSPPVNDGQSQARRSDV